MNNDHLLIGKPKEPSYLQTNMMITVLYGPSDAIDNMTMPPGVTMSSINMNGHLTTNKLGHIMLKFGRAIWDQIVKENGKKLGL